MENITENSGQPNSLKKLLLPVGVTTLILLSVVGLAKNPDISTKLSNLLNPDQTSQTSQPKRGGEVMAEGANMGYENIDTFLANKFPGQDINNLLANRDENGNVLSIIKTNQDGSGIDYIIEYNSDGSLDFKEEPVSKEQMDLFSETD